MRKKNVLVLPQKYGLRRLDAALDEARHDGPGVP